MFITLCMFGEYYIDLPSSLITGKEKKATEADHNYFKVEENA